MWTGECMRTFHGHTSMVNVAIKFSCHNSSPVFTASLDGTAKMWSADTGECLRTFGQASQGPESYAGDCEALALSRDGESLLTCCGGSIQLWSVKTGHCTGGFDDHTIEASMTTRRHLLDDHTIEQDDFTVHSVAVSPDGSSVLACGCDWDAFLWNLQSGKFMQRFSFPPRGKEYLTWRNHDCSAAFSPDGSYIITTYRCSSGKRSHTEVKLWSVDSVPMCLGTFHCNENERLLGVITPPVMTGAKMQGCISMTLFFGRKLKLWLQARPK